MTQMLVYRIKLQSWEHVVVFEVLCIIYARVAWIIYSLLCSHLFGTSSQNMPTHTPVMLSLSPSVHLCRLCPRKKPQPKKKKNSSKCVLCASCAYPLNNFRCWQFQQTAPRSMHLWHHEKCLVVCGVKKKRKRERQKTVSQSGVYFEWHVIALMFSLGIK